jgi:hypothetical protein
MATRFWTFGLQSHYPSTKHFDPRLPNNVSVSIGRTRRRPISGRASVRRHRHRNAELQELQLIALPVHQPRGSQGSDLHVSRMSFSTVMYLLEGWAPYDVPWLRLPWNTEAFGRRFNNNCVVVQGPKYGEHHRASTQRRCSLPALQTRNTHKGDDKRRCRSGIEYIYSQWICQINVYWAFRGWIVELGCFHGTAVGGASLQQRLTLSSTRNVVGLVPTTKLYSGRHWMESHNRL